MVGPRANLLRAHQGRTLVALRCNGAWRSELCRGRRDHAISPPAACRLNDCRGSEGLAGGSRRQKGFHSASHLRGLPARDSLAIGARAGSLGEVGASMALRGEEDVRRQRSPKMFKAIQVAAHPDDVACIHRAEIKARMLLPSTTPPGRWGDRLNDEAQIERSGSQSPHLDRR